MKPTHQAPHPDFVTHLECSDSGEKYAHDRLHGLSKIGRPLLVRYALPAIGQAIDKATLRARPEGLWRYREFLPLPADATLITLGEAQTPLLRLGNDDTDRRQAKVMIKDEGRLPTGSFKARGMALAVTMAAHFGVKALSVPTAGNAGSAAAAYGARAGMTVFVFTPEDTPDMTVRETALYGARVYRVNGLIDVCGRIAREGSARFGWHDLTTLTEPYRLEGKKTMGLELAEQLDWKLPDVIYYPTGGGTGFIGMWKAFRELEAIGWLDGKMPRMVAVQADGCCPVKRAFEAGLDDIEEAWSDVDTEIHGVRVPKPLGGALILDVIRQSNGHAVSVSDEAAIEQRTRVAARHGINLCIEGAACIAAHQQDLVQQRVYPEEQVVIFNTALGLKTSMPSSDVRLDIQDEIDFESLR